MLVRLLGLKSCTSCGSRAEELHDANAPAADDTDAGGTSPANLTATRTRADDPTTSATTILSGPANPDRYVTVVGGDAVS